MASILYYSTFCEPSKKCLKYITQNQLNNGLHFVCIDKRVREKDGKIYVILQNGQKLVLPEIIQRVPALLLMSQNYKVLYGDDIYAHLKPVQQEQVRIATQSNMEPQEWGGFSSGIASDQYSFLDQEREIDRLETSANGNAGLRQMHSYVPFDSNNFITAEIGGGNGRENEINGANKIKEGEFTIEALQKQRAQELQSIQGGMPRI